MEIPQSGLFKLGIVVSKGRTETLAQHIRKQI